MGAQARSSPASRVPLGSARRMLSVAPTGHLAARGHLGHLRRWVTALASPFPNATLPCAPGEHGPQRVKRYRPGLPIVPSLSVARLTPASRPWNVRRHVNRSVGRNGLICDRLGGVDVATAWRSTVREPSLIVATNVQGPQLLEIRAGALATAVNSRAAEPRATAANRDSVVAGTGDIQFRSRSPQVSSPGDKEWAPTS